jgi:hypothetical protein
VNEWRFRVWMVCFILALSLWILTNLKMTIPSLIFTILVATFELFLIRRCIGLHAQGLKVSISFRIDQHVNWIFSGSSPLGVIRFKPTAGHTDRAVFYYFTLWK